VSSDLDAGSCRAPSDPSTCTCASLRKAMRVTTQAFDAALQPIGLSSTQFTVLAVLAKRGAVPLGRLAEDMVTDRTTLTRNLRLLEDRGLLRVGTGADRRFRMVSITNRGRYIQAAALPLWEVAQQRFVDGLGRGRWAGLLDDLDATVEVAKRE
jgi:DNA-binding MarR family transcriptional regulator